VLLPIGGILAISLNDNLYVCSFEPIRPSDINNNTCCKITEVETMDLLPSNGRSTSMNTYNNINLPLSRFPKLGRSRVALLVQVAGRPKKEAQPRGG
jgi:hypothetical protein